MKNSVLYILLCALMLSGCNQNKSARAGIDPLAQNKAAPEIAKAFTVRPTGRTGVPVQAQKAGSASGLSVDNAHVVIQKAALGKEFLLSVNMLTQTPTPAFQALQSRIVSFILRENRVFLLDVTKNNVVGSATNIPQTLLIAEFPVLNDTAEALEIDFNTGMRQIFETTDMTASPEPASAEAQYSLAGASVRISYLEEVTLSDANALFIRQIAQIDNRDGTIPVEVRYQIKPYLPDPNFVPMISPGHEKVGYFEANPLMLPDGTTRVYAMKWNEKKPIKFAISANTPAEYRSMVKNALLSWNKFLGDKAIEVVQLEDKTQTAPRFDLNIFQWADWDSAGYAYADAHVDPRSGQVTSAQIFMPSAFVSNDALYSIRSQVSSRPQLTLKGFKSARLCSTNLRNEISGREKNEGVSAAATEKAVRDFVYERIAHELGHVLGLRHNFAGNLAANYDFKERKNLVMNYYRNKKASPGVIATSSVMEYPRFEESSWTGDMMQNGSGTLAYDEMAIKHLYFKAALPATNRPLFCTDQHMKTYADCAQGDAGRSVVSATSGAYRYALDTMAARLINFYTSRSKDVSKFMTAAPVAEVSLSAKEFSDATGTPLTKLVSLLKTGTKFLTVRSEHIPVLGTMTAEIEKQEIAYLQAEFKRLGGLEVLLKEISDNFDPDLIARFSELLDDPMFNSGTRIDGAPYSFSTEEKEVMKKQVALFAPQMREQLVLNEIKVLSSDPLSTWNDSELTYEFSALLAHRFKHYALSKTGEKLVSEIPYKDGTKKSIELAVYKYSENIRLAAVGLLGSKYKVIDGGVLGKKAGAMLLTQELAPFSATEIEKINMPLVERKVLQWFLINKKIGAGLL